MKLIVGLGNPGKEYADTRHNLGFMVIDTLARMYGVRVEKRLFKALTGTTVMGREKVVLAKPQTYMNLSGQAVGSLVSWYKPDERDILVILDDMDLPRGRLRLKADGGPGGHKGLASVIEVFGTDRFARLRVGIGRPPASTDAAGWVLENFGLIERVHIDTAVKTAAKAVAEFVTGGLDRAMNIYNAPSDEEG
ncbi:MAG: aminoacyl-tRNA hydrolase [Peptococcaceae bacterium]|jgi:PTH1 family peptidyl-tRNA hydrolase|nr:aminoacyl-tRNA hydrolase [Peptococcaceae bacterium]